MHAKPQRSRASPPRKPTKKRRDLFTRAKRSEIMSRIRSKNSTLDLAMEALMRDAGLSFKMYPKVFGNPDFLVAGKLAIFCDSEFWHGRNWRVLRLRLKEGSNAKYWIEHIRSNRTRDRRVNARLKSLGYRVLRFWSNQVFKHPHDCVADIQSSLLLDQSPIWEYLAMEK